MLKKTLQSFICVFLCTLNLYAQESDISGKITDVQDGSPLPGVTVLVKGTTRGTASDADGTYRLPASKGEVLTFSFIGYESEDITVGNSPVIDVVLQPDVTTLSEIVVVGYGEQKKVNVSGAVDAIDNTVLANRPNQNIAQGLQGVSPNLNIDFLSGEPGAVPNINIRGITSINGGDPLILVDGIPTTPAELNTIPPGDVASISVLKDASSAAIYGARAAYGVILITTKSRSEEGVSISYNNNFSMSRPTVLPGKVTDPYIYLRVRETSTDNTPWDNQNYSDQTYQWARERSDNPDLAAVRINPTDQSLWEYMGNKDWTKEFLDHYNYSQQHNLSISSRGERTSLLVSGAYDNQQGVLDHIAEDHYQRYALRSKLNIDLTKFLKVGNNTSMAFSERVRPTYFGGSDNDDMWQIYNFHPTDWDINPDGSYANTDVGRYMAQLQTGGESVSDFNIYQTSFLGQLSLFEDVLKLNADYTIRKNIEEVEEFATKYNIGFGPDDIREEGDSWAYESNADNTYSVFNIYTTFGKTFGSHQVNAVAGFNQEQNRYELTYARRDGLITNSLPTMALATGESEVGETVQEWAIRGLFFRANYIFRDRYIFEFNGRYDGSSKFPDDSRWGFFPSASVAWRVNEEAFFSPLTNFFSQFKLRGSYGALGNQFVGEYGYISSMQAGQGNYIIGDQLPLIVNSPALVSPNYTWEKVNSSNIGLDLGVFDNRITTSFDYYSRETIGMLTLGRELPDVLGDAEPLENSADLRTTGWELALGYQNSFKLASKPFKVSSRVIISDSKSTITRFDNPERSLTQYYKGMELGEIWGLESDGFFRSQEEIDALDQSDIVPWGALSVVEGWPKYVDQDNNGRIEKGATVDDSGDLSVIGNLLPRYRYSLDLNMSWKGFDLRMLFQGVGKRDFYPRHYLYWGFYQQPYAGGYEHLLDYYRATSDSETERAKHSQAYLDAGLADANTDARYPVLQSWLADRNLGERIDEAQGLAIPQTGYMLNGAYLRLKNLTIGYTLPQNLLSRLKISDLRVYVSGENIAEWSELKDYFDPESINDDVAKMDPSASTASGWGYSYPQQRKYSIGLSITL